jgi:hypothetical protein
MWKSATQSRYQFDALLGAHFALANHLQNPSTLFTHQEPPLEQNTGWLLTSISLSWMIIPYDLVFVKHHIEKVYTFRKFLETLLDSARPSQNTPQV